MVSGEKGTDMRQGKNPSLPPAGRGCPGFRHMQKKAWDFCFSGTLPVVTFLVISGYQFSSMEKNSVTVFLEIK